MQHAGYACNACSTPLLRAMHTSRLTLPSMPGPCMHSTFLLTNMHPPTPMQLPMRPCQRLLQRALVLR